MIYLDNSATSWPKPKEVYTSMLDAVKRYGANPGRAGHHMALMAGEQVFKCRMLVADFFGIDDPAKVIFTLNATDALNIAIKGVLKNGDHVIYSSMEHNSVVRPINTLAEKSGITFSVAKGDAYGYVSAKSIERLIRSNTKMIVLTHVSNVCGTINPVREVGEFAKKHGIIFMVDASQSAGILPIDVKNDNIDILAMAGHKGLLGPVGTGILYINDPECVDTLREGGTGSHSMSVLQPSQMPDKYESGTLNTVGIMGLMSGIEFINKIGMNEIFQHEKRLTGRLLGKLAFIKNVVVYGYLHTENRLGVVSFNLLGKDSVEVAKILDEKYGIAVRAGYHCAYGAHCTLGCETLGAVRVSIGAFNTVNDIDAFCIAVEEIANI